MKKLDDESVYEIKKLIRENKFTQRQIAEKFKISRSTISRIGSSELHRHIVLVSDEYQKGFEDGYNKALKDIKKGQQFGEVKTTY